MKKMHTYCAQTQDQNYFLETVAGETNGKRFYMTGWRSGVRENDYILLKQESGTEQYQIEKINYYCDDHDMWTALLVKCS